MPLLEDLDAFYTEHRRCGELDSGIFEPATGPTRVWMACSCGGRIERDADTD